MQGWNIIVALLIFTVIVVIHELGHFLLAKKNGITVTEFSVGMGPRLVTVARSTTTKKLKIRAFTSQKKFDEEEDWNSVTRYSWKLLPIGGSCMMVGEDSEDASEGSFNEKGVWARFSVIFAGPLFNFILAFVFSIILLANSGVDIPKVAALYPNQPAQTAGIKEGDTLVSINGHHIAIGREVDTYLKLHPLTGDTVKIVVLRDHKKQTIKLNPNYTAWLFGFSYGNTKTSSTEISLISEKSAFDKAGIKVGDKIISVNGTKTPNGDKLASEIEKAKATGKKVDFQINHKGKVKSYQIQPTKYQGKTLGLVAGSVTKMGPLGIVKYSGIEVKYWIETTVAGLGQLVLGKLSMNDISGPVGIVDSVGKVVHESVKYGPKTVLINILYLSILLSANLGVMNLLPLPALDGSRLVFIVIEGLRGKPIDRNKEGLVHLVGFVLILGLMLFVTYHDIVKLVTK